jgi:tetratricopeptide (TPR) repeat protein
MSGRLTPTFTNTESFMLFYEGLRSLQIFQDENNTSELTSAADHLEKCVQLYPLDALPLYYLGVVRSLQAEVGINKEQTALRALEIFSRLKDEAPDDLASRAGSVLKTLQMQYTQSDTVDRVMQAPVDSTKKPPSRWQGLVNAAAARISPPTEDDSATDLQWRIASCNLQIRRLSSSKQATPDSPELSKLREVLDTFEKELKTARVSNSARLEMTADLWNTRGLLSVAQGDATAAESAFRKALAIKPEWLPAKRNLLKALIEQGKSTSDEATRLKGEVEGSAQRPSM